MGKEKIILMKEDYTIVKLEDGIFSYDCCYCGYSYLEEKDIKNHVLQHKGKRK